MKHRDDYLKNRVYSELGLMLRKDKPAVPTHFKVVMGLMGVSLVAYFVWELFLKPWCDTFCTF